MSVLNKSIRSWWLEKPTVHNIPTDVVFEDYKPTITNAPNREWIRVISLDDLHREININITRYVEVCNELVSLRSKITKQAEIIKLLKDSNSFYENTNPSDLKSNDIEVLGYGKFKCGLYARSIRLQVEQLENEK